MGLKQWETVIGYTDIGKKWISDVTAQYHYCVWDTWLTFIAVLNLDLQGEWRHGRWYSTGVVFICHISCSQSKQGSWAGFPCGAQGPEKKQRLPLTAECRFHHHSGWRGDGLLEVNSYFSPCLTRRLGSETDSVCSGTRRWHLPMNERSDSAVGISSRLQTD